MNSQFTARVELHHATAADYDRLHGFMAQRGFSRNIVADDGVTYELPTGTYSYTRNGTGPSVRQAAADAASATRRTYAVVVTEGPSYWTGLEKARPLGLSALASMALLNQLSPPPYQGGLLGLSMALRK